MTNSPPKNGRSQTLDSEPLSEAPSLDVLFELFAHPRRRHALKCLCKHQTPMALADVAREVATREQETPIPEIPLEEVKQVHVSLTHVHIPKLADADIVEYNQDREVVSLSMERNHLESLIERVTENE